MRSLLALLVLSPFAFADPLECIPKQAGVILKIESPRVLVESAVRLDAWKSVQAFPQVKEVLDSANVRRFFQVLTYIEKETGTRWPELLDKFAGHGIALGFKPGTDPAPTLAVIEGTDEAIVAKVYAIFVAGIKDEAARDGKAKVVETIQAGVSTLSLGDDAHFAQVGSRVFLANKLKVLHAGLEMVSPTVRDKRESILDHPTLQKARNLLGKDAVAWLWFDLAAAKETQEGKDFFENSQKEIFQYLVLGSSIDAARRSDFLAVGLYAKPEGYRLSLRLPAGRDGLVESMRLHVPDKGTLATRPLLEPDGVVLSQSFFLDLGAFWKNRKAWVGNEERLNELEKGVADISKLLPGTTFGTLLEQSGPHHRFVMAQTGEKLYEKQPGSVIPPTAYVGSMRDPNYGKSMDGLLRAGGLVAGFQTGWKMSEVKHDGINIVTYRFPETDDVKFDDPDKLRFNAAPSFAVVNDSLVVGTTPGIVKAVIPLLKKESASAGSSEVWKLKFYASGAGAVLAANPEATVTQSVLSQGVTLADAKKQALEFAEWFRKLGSGTISIEHGEEYFRLDAVWNYRK